MLEVKGVTKNFGELVAVNNISFNVNEGEIFGLLGTNGAGKTTTFRMIMGLLSPTQGEILWKGKKIDYSCTDEIGFLIEERSLMTKMTVYEQIMHYGRLKSLSVSEIDKRLDYWLDRLDIKDYKNKKIKELSKGNQQKIQFISAIINEPKLLILDEPFSGLDPINIEMFIEIIREFQKKGCCIIFSTHRIDHVELFCEKLIVLVNGKAVIDGYIEKIKDDFKRKTIRIKGLVDCEKIRMIDGVINVTPNANEIVVSVADPSITKKVFDYVKTCDDIEEFLVEKPSLNEIFIEKVGAAYNG